MKDTLSALMATPTSSMVVVKMRPRPRCAAIPSTTNAVSAAPANAPAGSSHTARAARPTKMVSTAPSDAPAETPRILGSASGLRNSPCSAAPDRASAPPTTKPSSARGSRMLHTTVSCQDAVPGAADPCRSRRASAPATSCGEMRAWPKATAATSATSPGTASAATASHPERRRRAGATTGRPPDDDDAGAAGRPASGGADAPLAGSVERPGSKAALSGGAREQSPRMKKPCSDGNRDEGSDRDRHERPRFHAEVKAFRPR